MKKLATYFFATVFFVALYPKECNFPYPGDGPVANAKQQTIQTTIDNSIIDIAVKIS